MNTEPENNTDISSIESDLPTQDSLPPENVGTMPSPGDAVAMSPAWSFLGTPELPGEIGRLGGYRILKQLGEGGMGMVFLAEDPLLGREVALKVMRPDRVTAEDRERFFREARTCASITHDNIITIYGVGEDRTVPWLAMQILRGSSLSDYLREKRPMSVGVALRIAREIAQGLAAAHARGLIHRDIKPANIWLEVPQGRVKVLDFGLARPMDAAEQLTQTGAIVGTPGFMAPEQAEGEAVDGRADLFSLGCVMYQMLTRQLPWTGKTIYSLLAAMSSKPPTPVKQIVPAIPDAVDALVSRLLSRNPDDRVGSATELVEEIAQIEQQWKNRPRPNPESAEVSPHVQKKLEQLANPPEVPERSVPTVEPLQDSVPFDVFETLGNSTATQTKNEKKPTETKKQSLLAIALLAGVILAIIAGVVWFVIPANGKLSIASELPPGTATVIVELNGKQVASGDAASQPSFDLKPGTYRVRVNTDQKPIEVEREMVEISPKSNLVVRVFKRDPIITKEDADWLEPNLKRRPDFSREPIERQRAILTRWLGKSNGGFDPRKPDSLKVTQKNARDILGLEIQAVSLVDFAKILLMPQSLTILTIHTPGKPLDLKQLEDNPLTYLEIEAEIRTLAPLSRMTDLGNLILLNPGPLADVDSLRNNTKLTDLTIRGAKQLKSLKGLGKLKIRSLNLKGCDNLTDTQVLKELPLEEIELEYAPARDEAVLKSIETLRRINGQEKEAFFGTGKNP